MPEIEVNDYSAVNNAPAKDDSPENPVVEEIEETVDALSKEENASDDPEETKDENIEDEWVDVLGSGQLKKKVVKQGEPDSRPQPTDICNIKLVGKLDDGTVVEQDDSFRMQLGGNEVVQGLDLVIAMMNVGEECIVIVGPRFAYGSIGLLPDIPPDVTITYTVELLKVDHEPDLDTVSFEKRKLVANVKRERGNWWYSRHDATKAIQCYRKALDILDDTVPFVDEKGNPIQIPDDVLKECSDLRLKVFNNLAAAQLMIQAYDSALASVENVIQCEPSNVKALFRKGKILTAKGCINEAIEILKQAFHLQPDNSAVKSELNRCLKIQQQEKQHEKNLYKKMLGQDKTEKEKGVEKPVVSFKILHDLRWQNRI